MKNKRSQNDHTTDEDGAQAARFPVRPGSPVYRLMELVAANIAGQAGAQWDAHVRPQEKSSRRSRYPSRFTSIQEAMRFYRR